MPKQLCNCAQCNKELRRWPINPITKKPIKNFFCDTTCKGRWQTEQREALGFTREWLFDQYVTQGKNANLIAKEIGRNGKRVWEWLTDYGIPTRPRGGFTMPHAFQKGQVNPFKGRKHSQETKDKLRAISIADGRVPWGKGNEPYWRGVTGDKHPAFKGGLTPERQAVYSSKEWVEAVKKVWARDNAICQLCGKDHRDEVNRGTFHVHHIVSFQVKALQTKVSNLVLLCRDCHKFVHSKRNVTKKFIKEKTDVS